MLWKAATAKISGFQLDSSKSLKCSSRSHPREAGGEGQDGVERQSNIQAWKDSEFH